MARVSDLPTDPSAAKAATIAAYDASAAAYRDGTVALAPVVAAAMDTFADLLGAGGRVLEIGSGPGRDARALEERGLSVRRTDVAPGFVALLRAAGHAADLLDPLVDDLTDPERHGRAYDGVWANACLLHVARPDLPLVLRRLAGVTRGGGALHASLKEGDGEGWSAHGNVSAPRLFVYWRELPLLTALDQAGWRAEQVERYDGVRGDRWLQVMATRKDA
jgi:SAM-dependent methyltransferase